MTLSDIIIQWAIFAIVTFIVAIRRQLTIYHPISIYLVFHMVVFCLRPTMIYLWDFDTAFMYMRLDVSDQVLQKTLVISNLGLIVFTFAFSLACHKGGVHDFGRKVEITPTHRRTFLVVVLPMLPLAAYSIFGSNMQGEHVGGVYIMTGTSGYLNDFQQVLIPITVLTIVIFKWRWWTFIPFLIFIYFRLNAGWARWTVLLPFLAVILFHCWTHRKNLPSWKFILPLPLLLFVFNQLSHNRMYFKQLIEGIQTDTEVIEREIERDRPEAEVFKEEWDTLDFANFDYLAYIVDVVPEKTRRYSYGVQHLQIFTEPIPRAIWKGKPKGPPIRYFDLNNYGNFLGLTVSIVGDGWITFGWIGVCFNMALAGIVLGKMYNWFANNQDNFFVVTFYLICLSVLLQLFRDGSLTQIAKFMLFTQLPVVCWWYTHTRLQPAYKKAIEPQSPYEES